MTKRNARNRRQGTNEMAGDAATLRRKGRTSPTTAAADNVEYTMIDLVRSVEKLHVCKSGDTKDTVLWADVKKYYKKSTGCVLTTEAFNKLAGVTGMSRKDLIAGPLAGLLVAEDPAALVIRFKYDANKGDPLINHRFYLEATGAKTSVHHANDYVSPRRVAPDDRRLADVTNTVSPSRSETSSSLSPTCLSSISTDPDTEALSPMSASSPLSSAPLSPETREFVTANDDEAPTGEQSFLTARTSPMTSDWETSMSSRGDTATPESPLDRSTDQEKTLNLLDVSHGAGDTTIGANEVLVEMDSPLKEDSVRGEEEEKTVKEEEKKEQKEQKEDSFEEGSDKENHIDSSAAPAKPLEAETGEEGAAAAAAVTPPLAVAASPIDEHDEVIVVPDAVQEVVVETTHEEREETEEKAPLEDNVVQSTPVEGEEKEHTEPAAAAAAVVDPPTAAHEEQQHDLAAGDGPIPVQPSLIAAAAAPAVDATSPVTASSSDETLLTVIERPATVPPVEEEVEEHKEEPEATQPADTVVDMEVEEEVIVLEKEEELTAPAVSAAVTAVEHVKEEEEALVVEEESEEESSGVKDNEDKERREDEEQKRKDEEEMREAEEKREEARKEDEQEEEKERIRVEVMSKVEPTTELPHDESAPKEEEATAVVDTVVMSETVVEIDASPKAAALATEEEDVVSSTTDEPTATTMVSAAAVAPLQQVQQPSPVLAPPPPPAHEPMTSDDVDMNDILAGGPARDVHTPSVTAPITLQPKPAKPEEKDDTEVITSQPVVDQVDAAPAAAAAASTSKDDVAASPDLALRRAAPTKKFPCCTIV